MPLKACLNAIKVIVAEDHQSYSDMLVSVLGEAGIVCLGQARNGRELINLLANGVVPDIILLDIKMPELDGNEAYSIIASRYPGIMVVIVSQFDDPFFIKNYFERGVKAYFPKAQHVSELVFAIKKVAQGEVYKNNIEYFRIGDVAQKPAFSQRELQIIKLITEGKFNKEIADTLCVSIKTIELDRNKIYKKAQVKTLTEFMQFVNASGWFYLKTG